MSKPHRKYAIDFDGVIRGWDNELLPGARDAIERIRGAGHRVLIHSCNDPTFIRQWLNEHGIVVDHVLGESDGKPVAHVYIDDNGLRHISWDDTLNQLTTLNLI